MIALEIVRGIWGACEMVAPGRVAVAALGRSADRRERMVLRVLGARHLVQAVLTARTGADVRAAARSLGGVVDVTHGASMLLLALLDRRRARAAGTSAAIAFGFGTLELVIARARARG